MARIELVDVSLRDGNQSLWGATGLTTPMMLQIAPVLNRVGFKALDFISSSHMGAAVRYQREDPWERIRRMHRLAPDTPLQFITTGMRFISWESSSDEFMRLVYRRLVANGISRFILLDPMHDKDNLLRAARIAKEEGAEEIMAALTYTVSAVHDDNFYADFAATVAASPHFDRAYIKDPTGLLTPERARTLIPAVRARLGDLPLELHSHCTLGQSQFSYLVAAELGIDVLHVGIGPLGNGTSLPPARRTIANLRDLGHTIDIDDQALARVAQYFERVARTEGLPAGRPGEFDAAFVRHQVPGGVMTTMRRQLAEMGMAHRIDEVIEEVEQVRAELGYPIMVTPFPQIVCTQATFNIMSGERYATVPDQVTRYILGKFGRPTAPVDDDVRDRIVSSARAREIMDEPPPPSLAEIRRRFPRDMSDDEFLLRAVMPAEQVDAMKAAGPARRTWDPDARSVIRLLEGLSKRPRVSGLVVENPGFRLALGRSRPSEEEADRTADAAPPVEDRRDTGTG